MTILVTGAAGFIGFHTSKKLIERGHTVVGIDNISDYYNPQLKFDRLKALGIDQTKAEKWGNPCISEIQDTFCFYRMDLNDSEALDRLFNTHTFEVICNLAAQPGVRYSLENPTAYIDSNIAGFLNILEQCRHHNIKHLVYASSSSVYGENKKVPFETTDPTDHPISLYAATKKSNELMAYSYSHLYGFATTGLRFFTVYGPWGRPDMAIYLFTDAIANGRPIKVFNKGNLERDFTYIDDIVQGIVKVIEKPMEFEDKSSLYRLYNIGNNKSVRLTDFIQAIEKSLGKKAEKIMMPMQPGDVPQTWANVNPLIRDFGYCPNTPVDQGVANFVKWYKKYSA